MPVLHIWISEEAMAALEVCSKNRDRTVDDLAAAAIEDMAIRDAASFSKECTHDDSLECRVWRTAGGCPNTGCRYA